MTPEFPAPVVRPALPHERVAIQAATWPDLPPWAGSADHLRVAVAGRRSLLLGCAWEVAMGDALEGGVAVSPSSQRARAASQALVASFQPHPTHVLHWTRWLDLDDPDLPLLQRVGFIPGRQMMSYAIPNHSAGHLRLARGETLSRKRMAAAGLAWGTLDESSVGGVRLACLKEGLMSAREFDLQYAAGAFDRALSPVVWQGGEIVGFIVAMAGETFEVALMYVSPQLRRTGVNGLLLAEVIRRKTEAFPGWRRIVFRGDPEANPRTRRMCLRFGGSEEVACLKLQLPPASRSA